MCEGDRLVADFVAGTDARPALPELAEECLTTTVDGLWVVWAYKLARQEGDVFVPLIGGPGYPVDARATCRVRGARRGHQAPDPDCTCGFHALSSRQLPRLRAGRPGFSLLTVALSGRVLAFEWDGGGMLWRAERQTVVRVQGPNQFDGMEAVEGEWPVVPVGWTPGPRPLSSFRRPGDPDGRLAAVRPATPRDSGPIRLNLPVAAPVLEMCHDDAGWCVATRMVEQSPGTLVLA